MKITLYYYKPLLSIDGEFGRFKRLTEEEAEKHIREIKTNPNTRESWVLLTHEPAENGDELEVNVFVDGFGAFTGSTAKIAQELNDWSKKLLWEAGVNFNSF